MHPFISNIQSSVTKLKDILTKHWHILQANQSYKKTLSTLLIIASRKDISLKQIIGTNTINKNEKLIKTKNNHHTGKCVSCNSTRCLCCQQLISTTTFKSNQTNKTFKIYRRVNCQAVSLYIYQNAVSATFNKLVNQKQNSTLGSIITEKMSKIPMQYQLGNISKGAIMTLTIMENHYHRTTKQHSHDIN